MHGRTMGYVLIAAGALAVGLVVSGTPLQSLLPLVLLLACPVMMIFMMRGMGGHSHHDQGDNNQRNTHEHDDIHADR